MVEVADVVHDLIWQLFPSGLPVQVWQLLVAVIIAGYLIFELRNWKR